MGVLISCGIMMYSKERGIFLVRPTGNKRTRCWGIPKGIVNPGETFEEAARREFNEETGICTSSFDLVMLGEGGYRGKRIISYFTETDGSQEFISCNLISSGHNMSGLPENAEAKWISIEEAKDVIHKSQIPLLEALETYLKS